VEIKRGDIFLVDLNPVVGAEQAGTRPALVIQIDKAKCSRCGKIYQRKGKEQVKNKED